MKKLISLLAALAVVSTCTMSAFAFSVDADNDATTDNNTAMTVTTVTSPTKYEADATTGNYTVDASVVGTQDQTTILAVKGDVIRLDSIEYIDQSATQSFSFALRNELAAGETVNVLVGGSNGTVYNTGYMQGASESTDPEEPTTYTVSGTVENFVSQDFIDEELIPYVEELFEGDQDSIDSYTTLYISGYATTARLYNKTEWKDSLGSEYLAYYEEGADVPEAIATITVDSESGAYTFSNVEAGDYVLVLDRQGALPYFKYVTVSDSNINVDSISLVLGDSVADYATDFGDVYTIIENITDLGSDEYVCGNDANVDLAVDFGDVYTVIANITDIWAYGEDAIDELIE